MAIRVIRHLGIVGECNIQFALDPASEAYRVIEVNARLSRSSALASKATGYPLAFVAAKLALGHSLLDLRNQVTKVTTACFEPALDYVVVKVPRWDLTKFRGASRQIGSSMKSVGEVMAIGRRFEEALQKALRMLDTGVHGLLGNDHLHFADLEDELRQPTDLRIFAIPAALEAGYTVERIHQLTHIDKWFLHKINNLLKAAGRLRAYSGGKCPRGALLEAKELGFSDYQIGKLLGCDEQEVRETRKAYRPRAGCEADRHPRGRIPLTDQLPLPHLRRVQLGRGAMWGEIRPGARLGGLPHRQFRRVRLVLRHRCADSAGTRLPLDCGELQPRDGQHRL